MVKGLLGNAETVAQSDGSTSHSHSLNSVTCHCTLHLGLGTISESSGQKGNLSLHLKEWICLISAEKWQILKEKKRGSVSVIFGEHASCLFLTWVEIRWNWLFLFHFFCKFFISLYQRLITETYVTRERILYQLWYRCFGLHCFKHLNHS